MQARTNGPPPTWILLERYAVMLVNQERLSLLGSGYLLTWHAGAAHAARSYSLDQLYKGYFSHVSPEGEDLVQRLRRLNIRYQTAGENIAWLMGTSNPS